MKKNAVPKQLGRYEIIRELGKGAMGVVYEGRDPSLGRRVAIKTARREVIERSDLAKEMMERFLREARAAGVLNHPNIITIYDVGEEEGIAYIAMEFLEGKDLSTIIDEQHKFDIETVVNYGTQICGALACAHDQGVFHRDVKPANIFIPDQGVLKMVDFGIARTHDSTLTQEGALIGTPTYMSPEQFMGQKVDARSDLFALGIILYEMLTGEKPFAGEALTTIMHHILKSDPAPPHELNYLVPEALSAVVMKALSKRPQERYPNGRAMALALRESMKDNPDMNVITGGVAGAEVTVVSVAPPQSLQTQANTASDVIKGTTVSRPSAPAGDAAATGNIPPKFGDYSDPRISMQKDAPDAAAPQTTGATPAAGQSLFQTLVQHNRIILGGIAILCIIAGFAIYLLSPTPIPSGGTTPIAGVAPDTQGSAVAPTRVRVAVYTTADGTVYSEYSNLQFNTEADIASWLETDMLPERKVAQLIESNWFVQISDPESKTVYDKQPLIDGIALVSAPGDALRVRYDIFEGDASIDNVTLDAPKWQAAQAFLVYIK